VLQAAKESEAACRIKLKQLLRELKASKHAVVEVQTEHTNTHTTTYKL
jgi:hypothetical protein